MLLLGLRSFVNEVQYRQDVWRWMKEMWGSAVSFPVDMYSNSVLVCFDKTAATSWQLTIVVSSSERTKFLISWSITFTPTGIVQPVIYPFFYLQSDKDSIQRQLDSLQKDIVDEFHALTEVQGIESAFQFLMDCLLLFVCSHISVDLFFQLWEWTTIINWQWWKVDCC